MSVETGEGTLLEQTRKEKDVDLSKTAKTVLMRRSMAVRGQQTGKPLLDLLHKTTTACAAADGQQVRHAGRRAFHPCYPILYSEAEKIVLSGCIWSS